MGTSEQSQPLTEASPVDHEVSDSERAEFQQKIGLYKDQVKKMRVNIDLFKDSVKTLQEKNAELEKRNSGQPSASQLHQMNSLFNGLKEDNERLAQEIQNITKDNSVLKSHVENQKMVVQQQSGIIKGLQSVLENSLNQSNKNAAAASHQQQSLHEEVEQKHKPSQNDKFEDTGTFLGMQHSSKVAQRVSRFSGSKTPTNMTQPSHANDKIKPDGLQMLYTSRSISPQMLEKSNNFSQNRTMRSQMLQDNSDNSRKYDPQIIYSSIEQQNLMRMSQQTNPTIVKPEMQKIAAEEALHMERTYTESTLRDQNAMSSTNKSLRMRTQQAPRPAYTRQEPKTDAIKKQLHFTSQQTGTYPLLEEQTQDLSFVEQTATNGGAIGGVDKTMLTHDLAALGRSDYGDSFVRYLQSAAPQLVHETSDISCVSKVTANGLPKYGNIAEELNNYDVVQKGNAASAPKRNSSSNLRHHHHTGAQQHPGGVLLDPTNSQMTARFSQFQQQQNGIGGGLNASILGQSHSSLSRSQVMSQSQRRSASQLNLTQKNSARANIKQNTRNLKGEISGVDNEIAMLQDCLFNATRSVSKSARRTDLNETPHQNTGLLLQTVTSKMQQTECLRQSQEVAADEIAQMINDKVREELEREDGL